MNKRGTTTTDTTEKLNIMENVRLTNLKMWGQNEQFP